MRMLILIAMGTLAWRLLRKVTAAQFAMAMVGGVYIYGAMYIDTYYARGTFEWFLFAALWLPIRWNKNVIHA